MRAVKMIAILLHYLLAISLILYFVDIVPLGILMMVKYPDALGECMKVWNWLIVNNVMLLFTIVIALFYNKMPDYIRKLFLLFGCIMFIGIYTFGIVVETADSTCKEHIYSTYEGLLEICNVGFASYTAIIFFIIANTIYEICTKRKPLDNNVDSTEVLENHNLSINIPFLNSTNSHIETI